MIEGPPIDEIYMLDPMIEIASRMNFKSTQIAKSDPFKAGRCHCLAQSLVTN